MSRVIVKNLPKQISEDEIRMVFSKKGNITDVKLKYKNGVFRRFAFIGYENEEDAEMSCNFLNETFIKHSRITVEISQDYGSTQKPVSWAERNKQHKEEIREKSLKSTSEDRIDLKKKKRNIKGDEAFQKQKFLEKYRDEPGLGNFLKADENGIKEDISPVDSGSSEDDGDEDKDKEEDEEDDRKMKIALKKDVSDLDVQ